MLSVDVISHSVSNIAYSCSVFFSDLVSCLLLHIFSKWLFLSQWLHLVPKTGHSILLIHVGFFFQCPLFPQYVQLSRSFGGEPLADCFFCLLYELPVTASIVCGSSRRDADIFPASFASANLRTCSNVISWFLSLSRSTTIIFNPPPPPLPPSLPDLWPLHSYWSSLSLVPTPSPQQYTEQQKSHLPKEKEEEEEDKEKEEEVEKEEWVESMVVRSYIDFLILLIPIPLVSVLFCSSIPTFCSFLNVFPSCSSTFL